MAISLRWMSRAACADRFEQSPCRNHADNKAIVQGTLALFGTYSVDEQK